MDDEETIAARWLRRGSQLRMYAALIETANILLRDCPALGRTPECHEFFERHMEACDLLMRSEDAQQALDLLVAAVMQLGDLFQSYADDREKGATLP